MWFWGNQPHEKESLIDIIRKIKNGNVLLKNTFIKDYMPFILKSVSRMCGKYIDVENSEEFSVGLNAFNEAIDSYDDTKNNSFISFAEQVIQRRLIDYKRSNQKHQKVFPFTYFEEKESDTFEEHFLVSDKSDHVSNYEIREEFLRFKQKLSLYEITLEDLLHKSPKHTDARLSCIEMAKAIANSDTLYQKLKQKKTLPFSELNSVMNVSKRTLERNRKYIIALVLIIKSDMDMLKTYINKDKE